APDTDEDRLMEVALESGALDVIADDDGSFLVTTAADRSFGEVVDALRAAALEPANAEVSMHPATIVDLDVETAERVTKLIDHLEDLDDVQQVFSNARFPDMAE
ncbi:MAG: YebC/PmpR family DNA-binding transcriptional regulator, partial [Gammaproteobacteria bacterium HGW-Gammaproteobacteria-14]